MPTIKKKKRDLKYYSKRKPWTNKSHYVGVEIECVLQGEAREGWGFYERSRTALYREVFGKFKQLNISKYISIVQDGSIETDKRTDYGAEIRIIAPQTKIYGILKKVNIILIEYSAKVNSSCGLHVHLDMRNRDVVKSYKNLFLLQNWLYSMVDRNRKHNSYCNQQLDLDISKVKTISDITRSTDRYDGINATSFYKHKTIEVRMHQGTVDPNIINNWIKLLTRIVDSDRINSKAKKKEFVLISGRNKEHKKYIESKLGGEQHV